MQIQTTLTDKIARWNLVETQNFGASKDAIKKLQRQGSLGEHNWKHTPIKDIHPECAKNAYISIIRQTVPSETEQKTGKDNSQRNSGVPTVAQWVKNRISTHEDGGSIPGLSVLRIQHCCKLPCRSQMQLQCTWWLWLWRTSAAAAPIRPLVWEPQ